MVVSIPMVIRFYRSFLVRKPILYILFVVLVLASCRSTAPKTEKGILDGEGQPVKVETDLEAAEKAVPPSMWSPTQRAANASYFFLLGEYLAAKGEMNKAYSLFQASYNLDPNPFLGGKVIASEAVLGKFDKALPEARRMVLLYPKTAHLRLAYGELLAREGKNEEAVTELRRAIEIDPANERAHLLLIETYSQDRQQEKALAAARNFAKTHSNSIAAWVELAKLNLILGHRKEALEPARRAYEMQTGNPELVVIYAMTLEMNGRSKEAIQLYEQLYRVNPTNQDLIKRMVQLYREVGNLDDALDLIEALAQLPEGDKPGIQIQRAILLWELKRSEEASKVLDKLAADYPDSDRLTYFSGLGHERLDHLDQALKIYRSIPESATLFADAQLRVAVILSSQKKLDEAITVVRAVSQRPTVGWEAYELGGQLLSEQQKFSDAITFVREGFGKFPDRPRLLFLAGVYLEKNGQVDRCIETMREVIKIDPTNSSAFNYLGYLFAERGEHLDEAEKLILHALGLRPNDGYYLDSLAWVYYQKRDYQKALQTIEKALAASPGEGVILEHLAEIMVALDKFDEAERAFEESLKSKLDDRDRDRIKKKADQFRAKKAEQSKR